MLDPAPDDPGANEWRYREGLFVGYRHYDRHGLTPAYCFGHGLGYSTFAYEDLRVEWQGGAAVASLRVRNTGGRRGKTVAQLYVGCASPDRPPRELRDFRSVVLDPGEETDLRFLLGERAFYQWDSALGGWSFLPEPYEIAIGTSSRDLRLTATLMRR